MKTIKYLYTLLILLVILCGCKTDDDMPDTAPKNPVTNLNVNPGIRSAAISWDKPEGSIISYVVSYTPDDGAILIQDPDSTNVPITGLRGEIAYTFKVSWLNNRGQSSPADSATVTTLPVPKTIFEGNLELASQSDIDQLDKLYTDITGTLMIGGSTVSDINDLTKLAALREIAGALTITNNPLLSDLNQLADLESVTGDITISGNTTLFDFCAISGFLGNYNGNLTTEGNSFNPSQTQIAAGSCTAPDVIFQGDMVLESQADLDAITAEYTKITGRLKIGNDANGDITDLSKLSKVRTVDFLEVDGNGILEDLSGLESLDSIITGNLTVRDNPQIRSLNGLQGLSYMRNDIAILNNALLTTLDGLDNLLTVDEVFIGKEGWNGPAGAERPNPRLTDYCALTNVVTANITALNGNRSVITANPYNPTFDEILAGTCAGDPVSDLVLTGGLRVNTQAEVDALPEYTEITGELVIGLDAATNDITDLSKFSKLTKIGGRLLIQRTPGITDLKGFSALTSVGAIEGINVGELVIRENASLVSLEGLENLTFIADDFGVLDNPELITLKGVENLADVRNRIFIGYQGWQGLGGTVKPNPKLTDYCAIRQVITSIGVSVLEGRECTINNGDFFSPDFQDVLEGRCTEDGSRVFDGGIRVNTQAEVDALESYTEITGELVIGLDASVNDITDLSKFSELTRIGGRVLIQRNPLLTSLSGLDKLESIGAIGGINVGELVIRENQLLTSLEGLESLTFIADDFGVLDNAELATLKGVENLENVQNRIFIGYQGWQGLGGTVKPNPKLTNYCALTKVIETVTVATLESREATINNGDAFGPSYQQILDGYCEEGILNGGLRVNTQAEVDAVPDGLVEITGELVVGLDASANDITDLSKFENVTKVGGRLLIQRTPNITDLKGFSSLTSVGAIGGINVGELVIREMATLTSLEGLENLTYIADDFGILDNPELTTLKGVENLEQVDNRIFIGYQGWQGLEGTVKPNQKLTDYCALDKVIRNVTVAVLEGRECAINNGTFFSPSFQQVLDGNCRQ